MLFSSTVFLFLYLPTLLGIYFLLKKSFRNSFLLIASLFFYAWGEHFLVLLMMSSICVNFIFGLLIAYSQKHFKTSISKIFLFLGIAANLSVLIFYKYSNFLLDNLNLAGLKLNINLDDIVLPIGISFYTFQSISYLIDLYRKEVESQKNLIHLGLYISLFPQLIAGPIVRYSDIFKEIKERVVSKELFKSGINRFIRGLAKKVVFANTVGFFADKTFDISAADLPSSVAWLGIICYSLQIYFDFSGYSDMAIGLGRMLGFNFKENFNYPYFSKSVKDFWRRWHISLSTWFRDYLYFPLGGNRKGKFRTYFNLIFVFFITGLWHGASWNFVVWGLFHGAFLLLERINLFNLSSKFDFLKRAYLLLVVTIGWVFFRSEDLSYAIAFIAKMFSFTNGNDYSPMAYLNYYSYFIIGCAIFFATPRRKNLEVKILKIIKSPIIYDGLKYSAC
tara:strand:+ start:4130 stop:5473 length:1344 start_codon:yes stop_codon:yes gene_type:complete